MQENEKRLKGDKYGEFTVGGHSFTVRYGYIDEQDRLTERMPGEHLAPVFPDFIQTPMFDEYGAPLSSDTQDPCEYYAPERPESPEDWCRDCMFYPHDKPQIGICSCEARKMPKEDIQ